MQMVSPGHNKVNLLSHHVFCSILPVDSFPSTTKAMTLSDTHTVDDWREEQCGDKTISRVISIVRDGF